MHYNALHNCSKFQTNLTTFRGEGEGVRPKNNREAA